MKKKLFYLLMFILMLPGTTQAMTESPPADTEPAGYHAEWQAQSDWPIMQSQEIITAWIKYRNTGTSTWFNSGDHPVRLGTSHNLDRNSDFYKHTWISANRPANLKESEVKPGDTGTFEFYLKAPANPGIYQEFFQPVVEGITWMEDWGVFLQITVEGDSVENNQNDLASGYHALWHSQSTEDITLNPGEITSVWVKFSNTGTDKWYNSGNNPIHLGNDGPRDRTSKFYKNNWLSINRPTGLIESVVEPNQTGKFEFDIQAPTTPGTYREFFTPVAEGLTWIGTNGVFWDITVTGDTNSNDNTDNNFDLTGFYSNGSVYLDWNKYNSLQTANNNTISGYKIVRSQTSTSPIYPDDWWVYITDADNTSYTDSSTTAGNTYHYRVGAYSSSNGVVEYTNHITIEIPDNNTPDQEIYLEYTELSNGIALTWDTYPNVDGYKLLRSESDNNLTYPDDGYYKYITGANSYAYTDNDVINGHAYHYRIGAYKNGTISAYSNTIRVNFESGNGEIENFELDAVNLDRGVQLNWGEFTDSNISGYKILRSTTDSNLTYPEDGYFKYIANPGSTGYVDDSAIGGQRYYYRIGAYYNGDITAYTNTIEITHE